MHSLKVKNHNSNSFVFCMSSITSKKFCLCVCVYSLTIQTCTFFTEHPSKCEEGKNQERERDRQHLQLSQKRCHLHPLPQLCADSERLVCGITCCPTKVTSPPTTDSVKIRIEHLPKVSYWSIDVDHHTAAS